MKSTPSLAMLPHTAVCLHLPGADDIFADGFDSGDTSAWSATVP